MCNFISTLHVNLKWFFAILILSASVFLQADDIDLYTSQNQVVETDGGNGSALTFLLDSSGSMSFKIDSTEQDGVNYNNARNFYNDGERRTIMKNAFIDYISAAPSDLKAGIYDYKGQLQATDFLSQLSDEQTEVNSFFDDEEDSEPGGSFYSLVNPTVGRFACDDDRFQLSDWFPDYCEDGGQASPDYAYSNDIVTKPNTNNKSYAAYIHFPLPEGADYESEEIVNISLTGVQKTGANMELTVLVYETISQDGSGAQNVFNTSGMITTFDVNLNDSRYEFSQAAVDAIKANVSNGNLKNLTLAIRAKTPDFGDAGGYMTLNPGSLELLVEYTDSELVDSNSGVENSLLSIGSDLVELANGQVYDINLDDLAGGQPMYPLTLDGTSKVGLRFMLLPFDNTNYDAIDGIRLRLMPRANLSGPPANLKISITDNTDVIPVTSNALSSLQGQALAEQTVTINSSQWNKDQSYELELSDEIISAFKTIFSQSNWSYQDGVTLILENTAGAPLQFYSYEQSHRPNSCSSEGWPSGENYTLKSYTGNQSFCNTENMAQLKFNLNNASSEYFVMKKSHREKLILSAERFESDGGTPIAPSYLSIADYYKSASSPLEDSGSKDCGIPDSIVMLTDGDETTEESDVRNDFYNYFPSGSSQDFNYCERINGSNYYQYWDCSEKLARGLVAESGGIDVDNQNYKIQSYGILFGPATGSAYNNLNNFARAAGTTNDDNNAYDAQTGYELVQVFQELETSVRFQSASAFTPDVSPGSASSFESSDELYYPLFTPGDSMEWPGNVKRYSFWNVGDDDDTDFQVVDIKRQPVYDQQSEATDSFTIISDDAWSWWSDSKDGSEVSSGGAASETSAANRNIYTYIPNDAGFSSTSLSSNSINADIPEIYWVHTDTATVLETVDEESEREQLVLKAKSSWGPVIHNLPTLVNQKRIFGNLAVSHGGDEEGFLKGSINTVYVGDNVGFLHAIDAGGPSSDNSSDSSAQTENEANTGGNELWSFLPIELLPNIHRLVHDNSNAGDYNPAYRTRFVYGIDGESTTYRYDRNRDGDYLDTYYDENGNFENQDHLNIYFGLRRGGSAYYGLDIADSYDSLDTESAGAQEPKLLFRLYNTYTTTIDVENSKNIKLDRLAETWSPMTVAKIQWDGERRDVLIFGGGYDSSANESITDSDFKQTVSTPQLGNAIYIVDAQSGELLSFVSSETGGSLVGFTETSMKYSIPGRIAVVDYNGGGADLLYATDLGGNLFRITLNPDAGDSTQLISGSQKLAALGRDVATSLNEKRVFFFGPSISKIATEPLQDSLAIFMGSGFVPDLTNNEIQDTVFMLFENDLFLQGPSITSTLTINDFGNVTDESNISTVWSNIADGTDYGWYMSLNDSNAEKVTGEPKMVQERLFLTSFSMDNPDAGDVCSVAVGQSSSYAMYIDGSAIFNDGRVINESSGFSSTGSVIKNVKGSSDVYFVFGTESRCLAGTCLDANMLNEDGLDSGVSQPDLLPDNEQFLRVKWRNCVNSDYEPNQCGFGID